MKSIMGNLLGSGMLKGMVARGAYLTVYEKHELASHGSLGGPNQSDQLVSNENRGTPEAHHKAYVIGLLS